MSNEQDQNLNLKPEILTKYQEHLSRELFIHKFKARYLFFQEFEEPSTLFQADLVNDKGEYTIIYPYNGVGYIIPYESLDMEFINIFEENLENPDQKPINFNQDIFINKLTRDMPASLKNYFGKKVETRETVYFLNPIDDKKRAIWQTTYFDPITKNPIAETWEGIIKGQKKSFSK